MKMYNPEKRDFRGRSYKKGGKRIQDLKNTVHREVQFLAQVPVTPAGS